MKEHHEIPSLHNCARWFQMETDSNQQTQVWWRWIRFTSNFQIGSTLREAALDRRPLTAMLCVSEDVPTGHPQLTRIQKADNWGCFFEKVPRTDVIEEYKHDLNLHLGYYIWYVWMDVSFLQFSRFRLMTTAFHIGFPMGPLQLGALECFKGSAGSTAWFWMWYDVGPGWSVLAGKDPLL